MQVREAALGSRTVCFNVFFHWSGPKGSADTEWNFFLWHMHLCSLIYTLFIIVFPFLAHQAKYSVLVNEGAEYDQCMTLKCFTPDYTKTCENKHPFHDYYMSYCWLSEAFPVQFWGIQIYFLYDYFRACFSTNFDLYRIFCGLCVSGLRGP